MENKIIKQIYYGFTGSSDSVHTAEYKEMLDEYETAKKAVLENVSEELRTDISNLILDIETPGMKYGFISGFKCAVRLMNECRM